MQNFHNCHACVEQVLLMFGSVVGVIIALDLQFHHDILGHFLRHSTQLDCLVCSLVCPRDVKTSLLAIHATFSTSQPTHVRKRRH